MVYFDTKILIDNFLAGSPSTGFLSHWDAIRSEVVPLTQMSSSEPLAARLQQSLLYAKE